LYETKKYQKKTAQTAQKRNWAGVDWADSRTIGIAHEQTHPFSTQTAPIRRNRFM